MTDENKQVVRRGFEEGFNAGDLAVFDEFTDVDYIDYEAMDQSRRGPEEVRGVYRWLKAAFPDLRFDIVDMVSEDDKVWTLVVFTGSHEGEFMGCNRRVVASKPARCTCIASQSEDRRASGRSRRPRDDATAPRRWGQRILNRRSAWTALIVTTLPLRRSGRHNDHLPVGCSR